MDARASAVFLAEAAGVSAACVRLLARACIEAPEVEAKIVFARHLYDDALMAERLAARVAELGRTVDLRAAPSGRWSGPFAFAAGAAHTAERVERLHLGVKWRLVESLERGARTVAPLDDEPSRRLLDDWIAQLVRQEGEARALVSDLARLFPAAPGIASGSPREDWFTEGAPEWPSRDTRFRADAPLAPTPGARGDSVEARIGLLHVNLTDLELATIEACARLILDFPEVPWGFVVDMARQCWDEARHAETFRRHLLALGGELGRYRIAHTLWELASGEPLPVRLALHQRLGEWVGVDGAIYHARLFAGAGANELSRTFEFVALDEITHVAFGNKWLRALTGSEEGVEQAQARAEERRREAGKAVGGPMPFPFQRWACELAGFTPAEVERLAERYATHGSLLAEPEGRRE